LTAPGAAPREGDVAEINIEHIGREGDGLTRIHERRVVVADALPGERMRIRLVRSGADAWRGMVVERLSASPDRVAPSCPHFGSCGGCAVQHARDGVYAAWKTEHVRVALARQGLDGVVVEPLVRTPPATRRRARLAARRIGAGIVLGFNARASRRIVDITRCAVLDPRLMALIEPLRGWLMQLLAPSDAVDVMLTRVDGGIDVGLIGPIAFDARRRGAVAALAGTSEVLRIWWRRRDDDAAELLIERAPARVIIASVPVDLPPGAFLQASVEGETAIRGAVLDALGVEPPRRVVDLYAGIGTLSLPLAAVATVHAVEGDRAASSALASAVARSGLAGRLTVERRDLRRAPLDRDALARFDGFVIDPPRVGAPAQIERIATASPRIGALVSCDPASFARDARLLVEHGWHVEWVRPIDQFVWSSSVEMVARVVRR
jgi:23S rRNA (uracil1939-C5)-methyltransferase